MEKVKVLILHSKYSHGGAARVARELHNSINNRSDVSCVFAYGRGPKSSSNKTFHFTLKPEIYLHVLLTRTIGLHGFGSIFSTRRLAKYIFEQGFDLIHLHNLHGYYVNLSIIHEIAKMKLPIVWTIHDFWPITGSCTYPLECTRWKSGCGNCPDVKRYPESSLDNSKFMSSIKKKLFSNFSPTLVTVSKWVMDIVKVSFPNCKSRRVIPNGIDTKLFYPHERCMLKQKLEIKPSTRIILFVAADLKSKRKGVSSFFESLNYIDTKNWVVVTVGKKIPIDSIEKSIRSKVIQLGYIADSEQLIETYSAADVFATASLAETFGMTVLEAMACGTPVVAFNAGAIPEVLSKDCGILVPAGDVEKFGKALEKLIVNDELREDLGLNCRRRAEQKYSLEKITDEYLKTYKEVLRGK